MTNDTTTWRGLQQAHAGIDSLAEGRRWLTDADSYMTRINSEIEQQQTESEAAKQAHAAATVAARTRPIWRRLLRSRDQAAAINRQSASNASLARLFETQEALQALIDNTPGTAAQLGALVKELKARKKELQLDKREAAAQLQGIRADARRKSASASTSFLAVASGNKYTAAERRSIRADKERALAGPEKIKQSIDRQLIDVDREIARLESLG